MANFSLFADILRQQSIATMHLKAATSRAWLRASAGQVKNINERELLSDKTRFATTIKPGQMYLFSYDPKTKEDLPYYDRLPLVFPFRVTGNSFYAINMHYLPLVYRARLMDALYDIAQNKSGNSAEKKLRLSYDILNSMAKFRYFKPCVKHYLNNHVRSRLINISSAEWDMALFLPLERFTKATKQKVHSDSVKQINSIR